MQATNGDFIDAQHRIQQAAGFHCQRQTVDLGVDVELSIVEANLLQSKTGEQRPLRGANGQLRQRFLRPPHHQIQALVGKQQSGNRQRQNDGQSNQSCGEPFGPFDRAPDHNSGPSVKWILKRLPGSESNPQAKSRRIGPTGEIQRMPKPVPVFQSGVSLNASP